jgi:hypothetical protein
MTSRGKGSPDQRRRSGSTGKSVEEISAGRTSGVDMIIPRILELKQRNREKLSNGTLKMKELISVAAARLMV